MLKKGYGKSSLLFTAIIVTFCTVLTLTAKGAELTKNEILKTLKTTSKPSKSLLPDSVTIKTGFKHGEGDPVGEVQMRQGEVLVVHKDQTVAFRLKKGFLVYTGDMLITGENSRLNLVMGDQSTLGMSAYSKLIIDKSIYDPAKNERSSTLQLIFGQIRCIVKKIKGEPNYRVRTPTAVAGVRGSDFVISVSRGADGNITTIIVTGPNTNLTLTNLQGLPMQNLNSNSVNAIGSKGQSVTFKVTGKISKNILDKISSSLADMSMPPEYD